MVSSLASIELTCVALLAVGAALRARAPEARTWATDAPIVALAALLGEDSAIRLYGFYAYADGWHGVVDRVPVLIPLIWVFVVLSARDVVRALGGPPVAIGFALILFDASLIEPCSTFAGLWRWSEPGAFEVPYIGIVGWACFGASALFWLGRLQGAARWLTVLLAPLTMHALLLALWWAGFRWVGRAEARPELLAVASWCIAVALVVGLVRWRRHGSVPWAVVMPRVGPAAFFLALLLLHRAPLPLWVWAAAFVPPWLVATRWPVGYIAAAAQRR